jgi:hypothetical protein
MPKKITDIMEIGEFSKKKRVNSRRKGNTFERKVAKMLNEAFHSKEFCRTPGSGAFATTHQNLPDHLKIHGDLITPKNFLFVIECKNGYDIQLDDPFKRKSDFWSFIRQAQSDAEASNKKWLVVYQKTRRTALVVVGERYNLNKEMVVDGTYYIYTLADFLTLPKDTFFA